MQGGGGISSEKEFDILGVAVRKYRRVGRVFLEDGQCDEGVRPRPQSESDGDLRGKRGRSRHSESRQTELTNSEG